MVAFLNTKMNLMMECRSYNNFTHWVHEYMRRPPFSGLLEDTVLLKLASPCPEAAYLHDRSCKNVIWGPGPGLQGRQPFFKS